MIETSSERRKARSPPRERTTTRVIIRERGRSRSQSHSWSRHSSNRRTSPQPHHKENIEYRHVPEQRGIEVPKHPTGSFEKNHPIHSAPAREEYWRYRHELRTASVPPISKPFHKESSLVHQRGTRGHRKKTGEAISCSQLPHEEQSSVPIHEDWVTYRRWRSESLSTHSKSIQERYISSPPELKEVSRTIKICRDGLVRYLYPHQGDHSRF